jgi:two-component system phosphate regulon sensor histidine kinase PhoR
MAHESILVVDDEADVLELCQRILIVEGYQVKTVRTGYAALQRVTQEPFDVLLTDINMPGMSGLQTAQAVKEVIPGILCVIMTGYSTLDTAIEALKLGVDEFIVKPFSPADLTQSIAKVLEKERLHKENIRLRSLIPLFEFNKTLMSTVKVDSLLHHVMQLAEQETEADLAILFLQEGERISQQMYPPSSTLTNRAASLRLELGEWIVESQETISMQRGQPLHDQFTRLLQLLDIEYLVGLPLTTKEGESLGALVLGKRTEPFASGDIEFLQVMTGQAAIAIENAHLFQKIQQAYEELKQLDHLKREFINIAAHELRTPLAILMGYASVMADEADEEDEARFEIIMRNARRLGSLIDNMLNLRYLETGEARLSVAPIVISELIQETLRDADALAREKSLQISVDIPADFPPLLTDRQKLDLIIINLLSNAVKYTPPGGHISITVCQIDSKVRIAIADSGIGIPPEERDKIFEQFYQVGDSLTRQFGGIGLGLALVKSLVRLLQGQVWVESEVGRGSKFTIELPLRLKA